MFCFVETLLKNNEYNHTDNEHFNYIIIGTYVYNAINNIIIIIKLFSLY